jgi:glycerol-3-phosphate acyltransferase PlsX
LWRNDNDIFPRVALLSNGAEPYKGCALVKETYARLEQNLEINFIGNLESRDIFDDRADVLVCDGFAGNVMLKTMQGTAQVMMRLIKEQAQKSWCQMVLLLCRHLYGGLKKKLDIRKRGAFDAGAAQAYLCCAWLLI